ncbi:copper homeostasis protein CutC [Nigerium massiliense]|uniref:copper homeostasis protein CutC n=1 Tax=Nigerium massiliense TaxID=1522317 RepID=UPI0006942372|nr:copper homeostasis protein CutC [Nigerium massiliense]
MTTTLEVRITLPADAAPAEAGGADRLEIVGTLDEGGLSPEPRTVEEVRRRTTLQLRPVVRLRAGLGTDGGEAVRLRGLIASYLEAGADGLTLGFMNGMGQIDVEVLGALLNDVTCPWTFTRAVDTQLDPDKAWRTLVTLPGLDSVRTAGSARDLEHGLDDLLRRAESDPRYAALIMADGDVHPDQVPWLIRAGVRQIHLDEQVRPGGSWKAYVDEPLVRSWRRLIDEELGHHRHPDAPAS